MTRQTSSLEVGRTLSLDRQLTINAWPSADTVIVLEDRILEKPGSNAECLRMLLDLNDRRHDVVTGVTISQSPFVHRISIQFVLYNEEQFPPRFKLQGITSSRSLSDLQRRALL
jgi:hypothetical protein